MIHLVITISKSFVTDLFKSRRKNFNVTRAVSQITHVSPDRRVQSLMRFRQRLANNARVRTLIGF